MNKNQLIIVLDSSVALKNNNKVGPALCFWVAYVYNPELDNHPISLKLAMAERYRNAILMEASMPKSIRSGAIYNSIDGPTKIFYDGIIRAMQACFYLLKKEKISEVLILGDCEHAVKQIKGNIRAIQMKPLYNQVKKLEKDYLNNGAKIEFLYIKKEDYSLYKKIDSAAKEMRGKIKGLFNSY